MKNYSQNDEQEIILNFIKTKNINTGKLLDVGAFDGETFSNVRALLLSCENWKAVLVEPSSFCFEKIFNLYQKFPKRVELINLAVTLESNLEQSPLLEFYESPMSAVSSTHISHTNRWYNEKNSDGDSINPRKIFVGKIGLKEILTKFGPFEFINIDVEGYSADLILQDWFNPKDYGCKILCVEHDGKHKELQIKFTQLGYSLLSINTENIIFGFI